MFELIIRDNVFFLLRINMYRINLADDLAPKLLTIDPKGQMMREACEQSALDSEHQFPLGDAEVGCWRLKFTCRAQITGFRNPLSGDGGMAAVSGEVQLLKLKRKEACVCIHTSPTCSHRFLY